MFSSCEILLCEFEITANICVYYASTIFTFANCLGNESGSNVVSLRDHVFHGLMLTTIEHVNMAIHMLTEQAVWTGGVVFDQDLIDSVVTSVSLSIAQSVYTCV